MLLVKLKQPVEKIYQGEGLNNITVTAEYLAAQINNYTMGEVKTDFYYKIGKVYFDDDKPIQFDPVIRGYVTVSENDLSDWGIDDYVALKAVSIALGVEIEETPIRIEGESFKA